MATRKPIVTVLLTLLILVVLPIISYLFLKGGEKLRTKRKVPAFEIQSHTGEVFNSKQLEGKIYATSFVFSRCLYHCQEVKNAMQTMQKSFKNEPDFMLLTFTIDPDFDTLEVIQKMAEDLKADSDKWKFLRTETNDAIYDLVNGGFFGRAKYGNGDPETMRADPKITLIDESGFIFGYFKVEDKDDVNRLRKNIKRLLEEKKSGKSD